MNESFAHNLLCNFTVSAPTNLKKHVYFIEQNEQQIHIILNQVFQPATATISVFPKKAHLIRSMTEGFEFVGEHDEGRRYNITDELHAA